MNAQDFWYIVAPSKEITPDKPYPVKILDEWLVAFRDENGKASVLQDRCIHRCAQLSTGKVVGGRIQCGYHGWTYNGEGQVVHVPSEGPVCKPRTRGATVFQVIEQDDYVYVRLNEKPLIDSKPFEIPFYKKPGWAHIRLVNRFANTVVNCAENFIDIPHTVFVHPTIFRKAKYERFTASVERKAGEVHVEYRNERANLGFFSWFLNPSGDEIGHTDSYFMPNVTSVDYRFGKSKRFFITSQSIPTGDNDTLVYTDLTYDYGIWNRLSKPIVRWHAQTIIDQDIEILANQGRTLKKYGTRFSHSPSDVIHVMVESIQHELDKGADPRDLPDRKHDIEFWV